jgi:hypothetical protein
MANTLINASGYQLSIESEETGINCNSFKVRYYPEINAKLQGITGETIGRGRSAKFSRDASLSGEVKGNTGIMAMTLATAVTLANDTATFGDGSGGFYLEDVTETQTRGENWRSVDASLTSNPLCA